MTSSELVGVRSAMPVNVKVNMLVEEGWYRVRNCSSSLVTKKPADTVHSISGNRDMDRDMDDVNEEINDVMCDFNRQMKKDGHSQNMRAQITEKVFTKWKERLKDDEEGRRKYYRGRKERNEERRRRKGDEKVNCFKG